MSLSRLKVRGVFNCKVQFNISKFLEWIASKEIQKITMVICNADTKETLECWDFKLQLEKTKVPEG